jgi:hypothetical protein
MGIVTIDKNTGNNMADNDRPNDMDFTDGYREFKPPYQARVDYRTIVALGLVGCVAFLVFWVVYSLWKLSYCWSRNYDTCQTLARVEPWIFWTVFGLGLGLVVARIVVSIVINLRQTRAIYNRTNLVLNRYGDQQPADLFNRFTSEQLMKFLIKQYELANSMQTTVAPYQQYRSVNSLSLNSTNNAAPMLETQFEDDTLKPIPSDEWLLWINKQPHVILAGATGKGKTVTAKPIIAPRIAAGEQLMIIDPHADYWFGLDVIGGGENWIEIKEAIEQISLEYQSRQLARETYRKANNASMPVQLFKRLTVVMDEGFLVSIHTNTAKRGELSAWDKFIEVLGSGARKVNISAIMLSQTANVEDLGVSGPLRENFTRIAVDNRAIKLMIKSEESDAQRRQQLYDALIGMPYPATTVVETSVVLLDRTGLDQVPDPHVQPSNNYAFVRAGVASNGHGNGSRTHEPTNQDQLSALKRQGITRWDARHIHGLQFTDADWTDA